MIWFLLGAIAGFLLTSWIYGKALQDAERTGVIHIRDTDYKLSISNQEKGEKDED